MKAAWKESRTSSDPRPPPPPDMPPPDGDRQGESENEFNIDAVNRHAVTIDYSSNIVWYLCIV